jgi:hypothetical protein
MELSPCELDFPLVLWQQPYCARRVEKDKRRPFHCSGHLDYSPFRTMPTRVRVGDGQRHRCHRIVEFAAYSRSERPQSQRHRQGDNFAPLGPDRLGFPWLDAKAHTLGFRRRWPTTTHPWTTRPFHVLSFSPPNDTCVRPTLASVDGIQHVCVNL